MKTEGRRRVNRKMNESGSQEMLTASGLRREKNSWMMVCTNVCKNFNCIIALN